MAKQLNRQTPWGEDGPMDEWFTAETPDGNPVGGLDGVFHFDSEETALGVVRNLIADVGKPLTVVGYTRVALGTYRAVMKVEKVESDAPVD